MTERAGKDAGGTIRVLSWALLVVDVLAYAALAVVVLATMGTYERLFARMGAALPTVTRVLFAAGRAGLVGILAFVVVLVVVKELVLPWPWARLWANLAVGLICAGFWFVYGVALFLPMAKLVEGAGG